MDRAGEVTELEVRELLMALPNRSFPHSRHKIPQETNFRERRS